jgi:hypothetical protein
MDWCKETNQGAQLQTWLGRYCDNIRIDIKTTQELLRHAICRISMEFYQTSESEEKRTTAGLAFQDLFKEGDFQHIKGSLKKSLLQQIIDSINKYARKNWI